MFIYVIYKLNIKIYWGQEKKLGLLGEMADFRVWEGNMQTD